jgi:hypothetical protein
MAVHRSAHAVAGHVGKIVHGRHRDAGLGGTLAHRARQRVRRAGFQRGSHAQQLVHRHAGMRQHRDHARPAFGQRAGLVEHQRIQRRARSSTSALRIRMP